MLRFSWVLLLCVAAELAPAWGVGSHPAALPGAASGGGLPCRAHGWGGVEAAGRGSAAAGACWSSGGGLTSLRLRGGDDDALKVRLEGLISASEVVVFMKGTRDGPKCGFSKKLVALLDAHSVPYTTFDILEDEEVRQGLKAHSNWPTYPQVYAHGKLVGGLDVLAELAEEDELLSELNVSPTTPAVITPEHLQGKIAAALGAERVEVEDMSDGCGSKFSALVIAEKFEGMPLIERQRAVHESIKAEMATIHALTLKCKTPAQAAAAGL